MSDLREGELGQRTLAAALRVERPGVVVDDTRMFLVDVLVEGLAAEEGHGSLSVERPVQRDSGDAEKVASKKVLFY